MANNKFADIFRETPAEPAEKNKPMNKSMENNQIKPPLNCCEISTPAPSILPRHLDPRPDIKFDHEDWVDMLQNCLVWDGFKANHGGKEGHGEKLWGVLHGLRCGGARIQRVGGGSGGNGLGYKLLPGNEDWKQEADWQRIRKEHLDGVKDDLIKLFKFTKGHGRLPRMVELWPETGGEGQAGTGTTEQTKLF